MAIANQQIDTGSAAQGHETAPPGSQARVCRLSYRVNFASHWAPWRPLGRRRGLVDGQPLPPFGIIGSPVSGKPAGQAVRSLSTPSAACAAARRATGTRYGLQET